MIPTRLFVTNMLLSICALIFCNMGTIPDGSCHAIDVQVAKAYSESNGWSIAIDLKGLKLNNLNINLIQPKGKKILDAKTLEFKNLERGEYIVIVIGRSEEDDYCPTYIKLSIE